MLFYNSIKPDTLDTLRRIQSQAELKETRLVGGTALALQLGHRYSIDLDVFGVWDQTLDSRKILGRCGETMEEHSTENIKVYTVSGIKVDVVYYAVAWLKEPIDADGLRLAGMPDIAPMKLEAINSRGSKKDFVDLAFLLKRFSLREILEWYRLKYPQGSEYLALRSLVYFDDAEDDPMPQMLKPMNWETVKTNVSKAVREYSLA
jgi:hypothetical protein